jgi:transcriptional regulator with XRE-family HTH domain
MTMHIGQQVGRRLKKFREARGLTQAQLGDLLGKQDEAISNFERGRVYPSLRTLEQLARIFEVPVKDFFEESQPTDTATAQGKYAGKIRSAPDLLPENDQEIIAGLIDLMATQRRRERD